jgi:hypothetical protein
MWIKKMVFRSGNEEEGHDLDGFAGEDREMRVVLEGARASALWLSI